MKKRRRAKILVIDDEKGVLDFFARAFPQYRIIKAKTGKMGLKKIAKKSHIW